MTQEELQALFNSENSVVIENKDTQEASQEELARMFESAKTPAPSEEEEAISKDGIEDNQPISSEKQTLIEDEYTLKKNRILKAKEEYPDNVDIYDLALNKLEQNKLDKIEQEKLNIIKKQKEAETLASARKDTALNRTTAATEMAWIGGTRPILGLSRIIEGATDYLGWTDDETTFFKDKIEKREAELNQYMKDKGLNPETMNVDDLMQFVVEWSPVGLANKAIKTVSLGKKALDNYLKSTAVLEGTTIGASTAGSVNEEGKAMSKGDITSSAIGGTFLVYGGAKAFKVLERLVGDISYEAQIMLRKADKTPEEVADILKDVPKSEQAKTLAEAFGGEFSGNYKQAISDSDDVRRKVTKDINERAKEFEEAVGMNDFENLKSSAERMYKSLELQMKRSNIEADVSDLTEGFTRLKNLGGAEETLLGQIEGLGNEIAEKPFMNITRMLEIRKNLNEIGRAHV